MAHENPATDWPSIERDYLAGALSIRRIAALYEVSEASIRKKAKSRGWARQELEDGARPARIGARVPEEVDADKICVERMKFFGDADDVIARAVGVDVGTLRVEFADQLANGYARRRRMVVTKMFEAAEDHNVSALKKLEEIGRISAAADAVRNRGKGEDAPEEKAKPMTKKEARKAAADSVTGKFAVPSGPKLAIDNTK